MTNDRQSAGSIVRQPNDHSRPLDSSASKLVARRFDFFDERAMDSRELLKLIQCQLLEMVARHSELHHLISGPDGAPAELIQSHPDNAQISDLFVRIPKKKLVRI